MAVTNDLDTRSFVELAELAASAADALSYLRRFPEIEKCRTEIEDGVLLCKILKEGYKIHTSSRGIEVKDVPVWRAFQKVSEGAAMSAETLTALASEAGDIQGGLERLLGKDAIGASDFPKYRDFFLRLAVSLGL